MAHQNNYKKNEYAFLKKNLVTDRRNKRDLMHMSYLERNYLGFFVGKGNNATLIEQLMEKRQWWKQLTQTRKPN